MRLPYSRSSPVDPTQTLAILVQSATVHYDRVERPALEDISLQAQRGTCAALIGPNGAGKSTLLKVVAGVIPLRAGRVRIFGARVERSRARVAYLPQVSEVDWRFPMSVRELALTGRYVHLGWFAAPGREDRRKADESLERLGLADLANRQIGQLSGGQRQRLLLARALTQEADVLLLDEPFNAVDVGTRETIRTLLAELRQRGVTQLVATHDLEGLEGVLDTLVALEEGRLAASPRVTPQAHHHEPSHMIEPERSSAWIG